MKFSDELRAAADDLWAAQHQHPFVRGIADGTVEPAAFARYVRQDYLFLVSGVKPVTDTGSPDGAVHEDVDVGIVLGGFRCPRQRALSPRDDSLDHFIRNAEGGRTFGGIENAQSGVRANRVFLRRAGTIIFTVTIVLWLLLTFPKAAPGESQVDASIAGKLANGLADDVVTATCLATTAPVVDTSRRAAPMRSDAIASASTSITM